MHGSQRHYEPPQITDYGDLWEITATVHPLITGTVSSNVNFSSPGVTPVQGGGATMGGGTTLGSHGVVPAVSGGIPSTGVTHSSHGTPTTVSGSAGDPGAGQLPFTGMVLAAVTGIGGGLIAAGAAVRRLVTRRGE